MVACLLLILIIIQLINSCLAVNDLLEHEELDDQVKSNAGWNENETRSLKKDIFWYEQLLMLAQTDSIYLAVDLRDNLAQIGIKGYNIVQTKILHQHPPGFLKNLNEDTYRHFTTINPIVEEAACIPKKEVKKVVAYSDNMKHQNKLDEQDSDKPFYWTFTTGSNLRVVITGVTSTVDSSFSYHPVKDIVNYRFREFIKDPISKKYNPTIYLWLSHPEAKAFYRAVPPGGKVLFRD